MIVRRFGKYVCLYIKKHWKGSVPIVVEVHNRTKKKLYFIKKNKIIVNRNFCRTYANNPIVIDELLNKILKEIEQK